MGAGHPSIVRHRFTPEAEQATKDRLVALLRWPRALQEALAVKIGARYCRPEYLVGHAVVSGAHW